MFAGQKDSLQVVLNNCGFPRDQWAPWFPFQNMAFAQAQTEPAMLLLTNGVVGPLAFFTQMKGTQSQATQCPALIEVTCAQVHLTPSPHRKRLMEFVGSALISLSLVSL